MTPLVRIRSLTGYVPLVLELGGDPFALLDAQHISRDLLGDEEAVVPYASVIRLLETTAIATGRRDFGLLMSRRQGIEILGPLALVVRNAATVREGLASLASHLHIYSPAIALYVEAEDSRHVRYVIDINVPGVPQRSQAMDLSLAIMNAIVALAAGKDFRADCVMFRHDAEAPDAAYRAVFQCPARFDQGLDALVFHRDYLDRRIDQNDPLLRRTIESYVANVLAARPMDLPGQVEVFVRRLLPTRECTLQTIAGHVSMHCRTLQRRPGTQARDVERQERDRDRRLGRRDAARAGELAREPDHRPRRARRCDDRAGPAVPGRPRAHPRGEQRVREAAGVHRTVPADAPRPVPPRPDLGVHP